MCMPWTAPSVEVRGKRLGVVSLLYFSEAISLLFSMSCTPCWVTRELLATLLCLPSILPLQYQDYRYTPLLLAFDVGDREGTRVIRLYYTHIHWLRHLVNPALPIRESLRVYQLSDGWLAKMCAALLTENVSQPQKDNASPSPATAKVEPGVFSTFCVVPPSPVLLSALKEWSRHYAQLYLCPKILGDITKVDIHSIEGTVEILLHENLELFWYGGLDKRHFILQTKLHLEAIVWSKAILCKDFLGIYFRLYNTGGGKMIF